jgi:NADPH:quinone reductase
MKAVQVTSPGGPAQAEIVELPVPACPAGHVLVKVAYAGINFMDVHTRQGKYETSRSYQVRLPAELGMEGSGTIAEVGEGVTGFQPEDRVAWCLSWGSYADYAVVPAERLAPVPSQVPLDLAAASVFQGSTAHYLVNDVGRLAPSNACLIHAAAGGIGQILVQLARRSGAQVFATASSPQKADRVRTLGAEQVFGYDDFADRVLAATHGRGVDVVFDAVGAPTLRDSFRATRRKGLVVNYGSVAGSLQDLDPIELGEAGSLFLTRPRLADHMDSGEVVRRRSAEVFAALIDGSLVIEINGRFAFEQFQDAHRALEGRTQVGKAVLVIDPTQG